MSHALSPRRWWAFLQSRPRLWWSVAFGFVIYALIPAGWTHHLETRLLLAWNAGALLYLILAAVLIARADVARIRRRAVQQHEGRFVVLTLVVLASVAVLVAIGTQLGIAKSMTGVEKSIHVGLAALTVLSSWLFTQSLFAMHYAHEFYVTRQQQHRDILQFPGTPDPDYGDFMYFACVIGTSGQTADVVFTDSKLRRIGTLHCVQAFLFNTTMLALTINVAAGLF